MMDRRDFLTTVIGTACMTVCSQFRLLHQALASVTPATLAADPRRPQFHLLPPANWMNDPNGPIYWKGNYHMFYQYNPNGAYWGDMHWGHAVSPDMVHWRHLPVALAPTPGGADADGCFSGTAVVDGDRVAVLYTGVVSVPEKEATIRDGEHSLREAQCLALCSEDDLTTWTKDPQPVIATPPAGMDVSGFRDPSPWQHGNWWYMVVGSGIRGKGGAVLLYRSKDLRKWEYLHPLAHGAGNGKNAANPVDSGDMWECPDFFPLGDKYVLIHSAEGKSFWQVGVLDSEMVFHPERSGVLDYGSFYAPKTQLDASRNRILWGWISEARPLEEYRASGWAGIMSFPRVLTLDRNSNLRVRVAPAVEKLRQSSQTLLVSSSEEQNQQQIAGMRIKDCCGEILCRVKVISEVFGFSIVGNDEVLRVRYDPAQPGEIKLDEKTVPLHFGNAGGLALHFYIDGSMIEAFVNDQAAYTKRFYYSGASAPLLGIKINGNAANLSSLTMWQLSPISPDRLTA
ncbi:MAG TPA: glycoside hydrolase family 32 protein [Pseudacidobacterium sp.]|jgi:beta-fructofuranosidase|nr:glycoside hydrolase family 32 protein [Pseudacidobacterium sp.]